MTLPAVFVSTHARAQGHPHSPLWRWLFTLLLGAVALLSGCGGGGGGGGFFGFPPVVPQPPAGLSYAMTSAIYEVGQPIVPNRPSVSGGAVERYAIAPQLPPGLVLDAGTGIISGTPTAVSAPTVYTVTATNTGGSVTAHAQIEVRDTPVAPTSLSYTTPEALYVTTEPIVPNTAQVTGGPASAFAVAPALPAGLSLNATTGEITGTPTTLQSQASYTVTASNKAGSVQAQVRISVTGRGSWTTALPIAGARHYAASVVLPNGKVLVVGGIGNGGATDSAALYDPTALSWTPAVSMLDKRYEHSATLLPDGRVLVVGGDTALGQSQRSAEIYDPVADTWTRTGDMNEARTRHTATLLPGGKLLVIGGYARSSGSAALTSQTAELYDPATGTWTLMTTPLSVPRAQHAAELLPGGSTVLLIGGIGGAGNLRSAELFPVNDSGSTTTMAGVVPAGTVYSSVRLADGSVLALGSDSTTAVRFHPATSSWTTSTLTGADTRHLPSMVALADGRVLVAGGSNLATAEIYNPDVNIWTTAAPMSTARRAAVANLLSDGSVLIVGGTTGPSSLDAVERFKP